MEGTIRWFNVQKGYGFIKGDDGEDYFVHYTQVPEGMRLNENDRVTFEGVETERGKQAQNIVLSENQEAPADSGAEEQPADEAQSEEEAQPEETQEEAQSEEQPAEEEAEEKTQEE